MQNLATTTIFVSVFVSRKNTEKHRPVCEVSCAEEERQWALTAKCPLKGRSIFSTRITQTAAKYNPVSNPAVQERDDSNCQAVVALIIKSLPKVIWEEGRVAAKVSHGAE